VIQVNDISLQTFLKVSKRGIALKLLETILIRDGKVHYLHYHQQRLQRSYHELFSTQAPFHLKELIKVPKDHQSYRCRVIYDQENISIEYIPYLTTLKQSYELIEIDFDYTHKYLNRDCINHAMKNLKKDCEAVFVKNDLITDTSIANVACLINNQWLTPKKPLLRGTTRERLLDEKKLILADISVKDFKNSDKIAFFNALTGFYELPIST